MREIVSYGDHIVLRFDAGDEIAGALADFADRGDIEAALVGGIGSASEVELGFYDFGEKSYKRRSFKEDFEVVSLSGNIGVRNGGYHVHLHGVFGRSDFSVVGGHIHRLIVGGTLEVSINRIEGRLERKHDDTTGLDLLSQSEIGI